MKDNYSIYVHIPFCKARCYYCAFSSNTNYSLQQSYFDKLFDEIRQSANKNQSIYTVYVGGGTPSSVEPQYLKGLFKLLAESFDLSAVKEVTVECNPESVTPVLLDTLKSCGVTRLSFGLQSANDATLKKIGRLHTYQQFLSALSLAQKHGFSNVNADLILGLPESEQDFYFSVKSVCKLPLQHVSVYALEVHQDLPIYKLCNGKDYYDQDVLADMYDNAMEVLSANGFCRYETSNFCKQGYECKHNLNYWQEGRYYAFGASASGFVQDVRYVNVNDICQYLQRPLGNLRDDEQFVSLTEQANEYVMLGLRLDSGVNLTDFFDRYETDFFVFFDKATDLVKNNFLQVVNGNVVVPKEKSYVTNSILCELLTL